MNGSELEKNESEAEPASWVTQFSWEAEEENLDWHDAIRLVLALR